jgi:UDP-N-acetylmuramoyl-tripeptide--D-alanyl-D-alanine ligase
MNIEKLYHIFLAHPFIFTDTRNVIPNALFFALKGDNFDGNKFAAKAIENGAAFAIIDDHAYCTSEKMILVEDALICLQKLATYHRKQLNMPVIGITGTNGKTTTKELLNCVLSKKYKTFSTPGNLNNHIGVPLSVLQIKDDIEIAIIELGASHVGEIKQLSEIAQPTHGVITNIGRAHLEGFGSFENVITAKTELYKFLEQKQGTIFYNYNNYILKSHLGNTPQYSYGTKELADIHTTFVIANPYVKVFWENNKIMIESKLIGKYNFENILCAMAVGNFFEVEPMRIKEAIEEYIPKNFRSQFIQKENNLIILDAYNANPTSMEAALDNFNLMQAPNKIVMLGDMLELGKYSESDHKKIIDFISDSNYSDVFLVGKNFIEANLNKEFHTFKSSIELKNYLLKHPISNALILVKGSRGTQMEVVVEAL